MRLLFSILMLIIVVMSVSAETIIDLPPTDKQYINFVVEFSPDYYLDINVDEVFISYQGPPEIIYTVTELNHSNYTYWYQLDYMLLDGRYVFVINAADFYGNDASAIANFQVERNDMEIRLVKPARGVSNESDFVVEVETEYDSLECKYGRESSVINFGLPWDEVYGRMTRMNGVINTKNWSIAMNVTSEFLDNYAFICTFNHPENYNYQRFRLGYDPSPPTVDVTPDPHQVVDQLDNVVNLTVITDDLTACKITDSSGYSIIPPADPTNGSQYAEYRDFEIDYAVYTSRYSGPRDFYYNATCYNLAGLVTTRGFIGTVDLDVPFTITRISPNTQYLRQTSFPFVIETNLLTDSCSVNNASFTNPSGDHKLYSTTLTLDQGTTTVPVTCIVSLTGLPETREFSFTVDNVKPTKPDIDADNACSLDTLTAEFISEDNGSGIDYYNYSIYKGNKKLYPAGNSKWKKTSRESARVDDLNLEDGKSYTWKIFATDKAGNVGSTETKAVRALDPDDPECDDEEPFVEINIILREPGTTIFNISCIDNGVGCEDNFNYSLQKSRTNRCTYNITERVGDPIIITESYYFCYHVEDENGNYERGKELIQVDGTGGPGDDCSIDGDCPDGYYCYGGECILEDDINDTDPASCSNGVKDGTETDVDCGGICDQCAVGDECEIDLDCDSRYCDNGICQEASCTDSTQNGYETDVDCGGGECDPCPLGSECIDEDDCADDLVCRGGSFKIPYGADTDDDGLPDSWEHENFGSRTAADAEDDPDRDGANNLEEYEANTDPNDKNSRPERKSILPLILLVLGILLMVGGVLYLFFKREEQPVQQEKPIYLQNKLEKKINPELPKTEKQKTDNIVSKLYKKRETQKKKESIKKLLSHFDEEPGKGQEIQPLKKTDFTKRQKELLEAKKQILKEKPAKKAVKKKPKKEGYVDIRDFKKQQEIKKQDMKKQVFKKLEGISKKKGAKSKTVVAPISKQRRKTTKTPTEKTPLKKSKMTNKEVFDKLATLSKQPKQKVHSVMKGEDKVSAEKMLDIFAKVTDKKQFNQDVFKVILSELVNKGKLTKTTVNEILFKFRDDKLLTEKEVNSIMRDLKLM